MTKSRSWKEVRGSNSPFVTDVKSQRVEFEKSAILPPEKKTSLPDRAFRTAWPRWNGDDMGVRGEALLRLGKWFPPTPPAYEIFATRISSHFVANSLVFGGACCIAAGIHPRSSPVMSLVQAGGQSSMRRQICTL